MKWTLINVKKETNHPFLNFYTLTYDVEKEGKHSLYEYYMASRRDLGKLLCQTHDYKRSDGVVLCLYQKREDDIYIVIEKQFRPPIGTYLYAFPAGLIDEGENIEDAARREAKEEIGANISNIELLVPPSPTSSGLSDENSCLLIAHADSFESTKLEEYEDISYQILPLKKIEEMMKDEQYFFPVNIRLMLLYLKERFHK